jgi:sterol desaturase/sphingolipid hydroxylase (fatty acid hydroxylase superfamily)
MAVFAVFFAAILMIASERLRPARLWPEVPRWLGKVVLLNGIQALVVLGLGGVLDDHFTRFSLGNFRELPRAVQVGAGYFAVTFVYYWWHRWRHEIPFLWRWCHQVHHSPQRLEVMASFYKHPIEILANATLSSAILLGGLGIDEVAAAFTVALTGFAELFYHWNIKTPRWLGWFFQRPEMHCVHHERGRHRSNYSDLPVWDMLFGTYENPETFTGECGFENSHLPDLLLGKLAQPGGESA